MKRHKKACWVERVIGAMTAVTMAILFIGSLSLTGCAPVQVKPGCEDSWATDSNLDLAMNAGAIGLSEYLVKNPEHRADAKKAIKAALVVIKQDAITLDVLVSALQKGISSREVRARLGYVSILGTGRQSGIALNACEKDYLIGYFQRLLLMVI